MTEEQFFKILEDGLKSLPPQERNDIVQDFREHFAAGREEGRTEAEIAASLGSPRLIAKEFVAASHLKSVEAKATVPNVMRAVWAVIGLSFFNFVIVLGPLIGVVAILVAGWATAGTLVISPLLVLGEAWIFSPNAPPFAILLFELFLSTALAGVGILLGVAMGYVTRGFTRLLVAYLRFNVQMVKGGMKA